MSIFKRNKNNIDIDNDNDNKKISLLGNYSGVQSQGISSSQEASVDLEDIIENYDGISRISRASIASHLYGQFSQLGNNTRDNDTTSFYTALSSIVTSPAPTSASAIANDPKRHQTHRAGSIWNDSDLTSQSIKSQPFEHFQVYWENLCYRIEPKISPSLVWSNFEKLIHRVKRQATPFKYESCAQHSNLNNPTNRDLNEPYNNTEPITIINQINGSFKSGELTAVMGPSGAGKTSLLNFLSRRREDGYSGQLYAEDLQHRIKISTIPQHDSMPEYLTVRENLMFASRLKNTQRNYDQEKNIQRVSNLLGLDDCLDTMTKKISGGQQKRLAIAQELLSRPEILILDEPTSGLDSLTCYKTISVLKDLVRESARKLIDPIAIVVTIHQPEQEVFELFDKIYLMAPGGIAIYNGPPDRCTQFVEQYSGVKMIDEDYNPASFLIELASGEYGDEPIRKLEQQVRFEFKSAKVKKKNLHINSVSQYDLQEIESRKQRMSLFIDYRIPKRSTMNRGSFCSETCALTERCWLSMIRDPPQMIIRISFHFLLPIAFALIFGQEPGIANACPKYRPEYQISELITSDEATSNEPQDQILLTLENCSIIFVLVYSIISANIGAVTQNFTLDFQRSLKEFYNGWYSMSSFIIARIISDLPMMTLMPVITIWLGYLLTGQAPGDAGISLGFRIAITVVGVALGSMIGQSIGMIVGAIYIGHLSTALFVSQAVILPMVFLSGLIVRIKFMSKFIYTLSYGSIYRHVLDICIITRYGFNVCPCNPAQITGEPVRLLGVSDRLRSFTKYWMDSQADNSVGLPEVASSSLVGKNSSHPHHLSDDGEDLFQLFAKQISLYNTQGSEIKSCKDIRPFQMRSLDLHEDNLVYSFVMLIVLLIVMKILLFITVKLVVRFKTSL